MYYGLSPSQQVQGYAPQGVLGDILSTIAQPAGGWIGGLAGNPQVGQQIGGVASQLAKMIPFEAAPTPLSAGPQSYAPQGAVGDFLSTIAQPVGGMIGDFAGNRQMGQQVGGVAGELAKWLPFDAAPTPAYAPQGILGGLLGTTLGGPLGGLLGGALGNRQLGESLGSTIGGIGGGILPFQAGPGMYPGWR